MPEITINYATIGGSRLAITNNSNRDNYASTLYTSYADTDRLSIVTPAYNMVATIGGLPLSISLFSDSDMEPSSAVNQISMFYALNIIENSEPEDLPLDPSMDGNAPINPSNNTFTWNGNRLSCSKKSERRCINIVDSGQNGNATKQITLMGVQMAQGVQDELILNKTSYTISDIDEYKILNLGGSPLSVGRIGNNYYLIVSPILSEEA